MTRTNNKKRKLAHDVETQDEDAKMKVVNAEFRPDEEERKAEDIAEKLRKQFLLFRDRKLQQWYIETLSQDESIRVPAQARLRLQLNLRSARMRLKEMQQEREAFGHDYTNPCLKALNQKIRNRRSHTKYQARLARKEIPASKATPLSESWLKHAYTLEDVLRSPDFDDMADFGCDGDTLLGSIGDEKENHTQHGNSGTSLDPEIVKLEVQMDIASLDTTQNSENRRVEASLEEEAPDIQQQNEEEETYQARVSKKTHSKDLSLDVAQIWDEQSLHLHERYQRINLTPAAIKTRLAFQKQIFDDHVYQQLQAIKDTHRTNVVVQTSKSSTRLHIELPSNPSRRKLKYSEHNLWELTSPLLWRYYKHSFNWEYCPHWSPRGFMRIRTVSRVSQVFFDFGTRMYQSQRVILPSTTKPKMKTISIPHYRGSTSCFQAEIAFLPEGYVKVRFRSQRS